MNYRDIRADLRQRLADIREGRKSAEEALRATLKEFEDRERALQKLLDDENKLFPAETASPAASTFPGTPTQAALFALQDGEALQLDQIKEKAEMLGLRSGDGQLGRMLHGALVGLLREGKVERLDNRAWRMSKTPSVPSGAKGAFD